MDVKKTATQTPPPVTPSTQGTQQHAGTVSAAAPEDKTAAPGTNAATKLSPSDLVTLSRNSVKQNQLSTLMGGFQNSLVDTLSAYNADPGTGSLYNLTGTPVDKYMNKNLANLTPDMKKGFMDKYSKLANTSGGLVPQNLVDQTFGKTGGFSQFLTSLTNRLNQLPASAAAPDGFPGIGGTSGTSQTG